MTADNKPVKTIPLTKMNHNTNIVNNCKSPSLTATKNKTSGKSTNIYELTGKEVPQYQAESNNLLNSNDPVSANIMLESYYTNAKDVPEDYPVKKIGDCPYTKAPSTDLPIANMPMCGINKGKDTRLRATSFL